MGLPLGLGVDGNDSEDVVVVVGVFEIEGEGVEVKSVQIEEGTRGVGLIFAIGWCTVIGEEEPEEEGNGEEEENEDDEEEERMLSMESTPGIGLRIGVDQR